MKTKNPKPFRISARRTEFNNLLSWVCIPQLVKGEPGYGFTPYQAYRSCCYRNGWPYGR